MVAAFLLPTWRRAVWSPRPTTHNRLFTGLPGLRGSPCCAAVPALSPPTRALRACPTSCGWTQIYSGSRLRACWPWFPQHEVYGHWRPCQALRAEGGKVSCCGGGRAPSGGRPLSPGERPTELARGLGGCWPRPVVCRQDAELCGGCCCPRPRGRE